MPPFNWGILSFCLGGMRQALLALTGSLALSGCTQAGVYTPWREPELPQASGIEALFNQRLKRNYTSPLTGEQRQGDDLEAAVIEAIRAAKREILVAVQELTLPAIADALIERHRSGVQVRVVLEHQYRQPWRLQHPAGLPPHAQKRLKRLKRLGHRDAVHLLDVAGVPVIDDTADGSSGSGLMHHKFVVIDQQQVVMGSANFTSSGIHGDGGAAHTRGNVNHLLLINSRELAELFHSEFALLWGDGPGGQPDSRFGLKKASPGARTVTLEQQQLRVLFSPHRKTDARSGLQLIKQELQQARKTIDLALFVFSAQELADVLTAKEQEGVQIRLLVDPGFAYRSYSELLDMLGKQLPDHRCVIETGNKPWRSPITTAGVPQLPRGDKLHHKFAVIDNRTVITGSFNWSPSAAHRNDETLLVIESPQLAAHFSREMDRLWDHAQLGITPKLKNKLRQAQRRCGSGVLRG